MLTKEDARKFLSDAPSEQSFWVNNGPVLKNLEELSNALQQMNDDTYCYHANSEKNDFSKWVEDVIGDHQLANALLTSKNKKSSVKKIRNRMNSLKKKTG